MNNPDLAAIENVLLSLAPAPASLDRDRLMFLAGRESGRRGRWLWCGSGAAAAFALLAVALVGWLPVMPDAGIRVVYVPVSPGPVVNAEEQRASPGNELARVSSADVSWDARGTGYFRLERQVLRSEEALPVLPPTAEEPLLTQAALRDSTLDRSDRSGRSLLDGF